MKQLILLLAALAALTSCRSVRHGSPAQPRARPIRISFHAETAAPGGRSLELPQSGVHVAVDPRPLVGAEDVERVGVAAVELGRCLLFQLTTAGAGRLAASPVAESRRRVVLLADDRALGVLRPDRDASSGLLYILVEVADAELEEIAASMNAGLSNRALLPPASVGARH